MSSADGEDGFNALLRGFVLDLGQRYPDKIEQADIQNDLELIEANEWVICVEGMCAFHVQQNVMPSVEFATFVHDLVDNSGYGYGRGAIYLAEFVQRFPRGSETKNS